MMIGIAVPELSPYDAAKAIAAIVAEHVPYDEKIARIRAIRAAAGFTDA